MKAKELRYLVKSDLYRYCGNIRVSSFIRQLFAGIGFRYSFWMRLTKYFRTRSWLFYPAFLCSRFILYHYMYKFGIQISYTASIGPGFYIGHFGNIVVGGGAIIGPNCNISQGVTIGRANRGRNKGFPIIGGNVYIGPGVKITGAVSIANNAAIGANAVVTKDIPENAVAVGIPAKVISLDGSKAYINRIDYN